MLVITDGMQTKDKGPFTPLGQASRGIKNKGVLVFAIGIGKDFDLLELSTIASDPKYVFNSGSFGELEKSEIIKRITGHMCNGEFFNSNTQDKRKATEQNADFTNKIPKQFVR